MHLKPLSLLVATPLAFLLLLVQSPAMAQSGPNKSIQVVKSDEQGLVLKLQVDSYHIENQEGDGGQFQRVVIPDMVQTDVPGQPQMPTLGTMLGIPDTDTIDLEIVDAQFEVLEGIVLAPAPSIEPAFDIDNLLGDVPEQLTEERFAFDEATYSLDSFFPTEIVEIGEPALMRDQRVINVQFTPVQFNPATKQVRLYQQITVHIQWDAPIQAANLDPRQVSNAYEALLEDTLINYDDLERPNQISLPLTHEAVDAASFLATSEAVSNTLKIGVSEDGIVKVGYDDLTAEGVDIDDLDPRTFQLHNQGLEIPLMVVGETDGIFDPQDFMLFYGTAITDIYTFENVYWLSWEHAEQGQRMEIKDGTLSGEAATPLHFPMSQHLEVDNRYWQTMPDGEGQDHWFWEWYLGPMESRNITITLNHLSTDVVSTTMRIRLKGRTDTVENPDHHTKVFLNDLLMSDSYWNGRIDYDHVFTFPQVLLQEGDNIIRLENVGDTDAETDQVLHNWIEIDYWDTYVAEDNLLYFSAPNEGSFAYQLDGFTDSDVYVFDVTEPHKLQVISNTVISTTGVISNSGLIRLQFEDSATKETRYLAITPADFNSPAFIEKDEASTLQSPDMGADYIIITHSDFYTDAVRLAEHRRDSGLRVAVANIQDVYDEFNGGVYNPDAIRRFLSYAYENWEAPAPTYVLLFGDAAQDYRNIVGKGENDFVPSQIFYTSILGETPTDNGYVAVSGEDILPDMFIGRLSVQSAAEAQIMVDKIIQYEGGSTTADWKRRSLLIADDEFRFESVSEEIADRLPAYYDVGRVYKETADSEDPVGTLVDSFNQGNVLVNYSGHGNVELWGSYDGIRLMEPEIIETLNNVEKLPILTVANCLNGYFVSSSSRPSLAELMMRLENKGSIAVWAPTDLNYPSGHRQITNDFYDLVFQDDNYALGQATTLAKISTYAASERWGELIQAYVLFGDPALEIGIPPNIPYIETISPGSFTDRVPLDQSIQLHFNKPMITDTVRISITGGVDLTRSADLPLTSVWTDANKSLTIDDMDLAPDTTYEFIITGQDRVGNELSSIISPTTWSLTTMADGLPPVVALDTPEADPNRFPATSPIVLEFDSPVRIDSVNFTIEPEVEVDAIWDELTSTSGQLLTLQPIDALAKKQMYTVTIADATDVAGNAIVEPLTVSFVTESDVEPVFLPFIGQQASQ